MSKQQSKKQQKEEQVKFEKIMEMYHHGNQEMAKYLALQAMENYIRSLMKKQFPTYVTNYFEDLLQEGYMAVLEGLETYDVKRAKPTTFFRFYIVHNMTEYITRFVNESTAHYQKNNQLIRQVERKYEKNHKEATDADIAIELGMNIETIKATRKIDGKTLNHIESTDNDFFSNQMEEKSPEEIILESEKRKALADKINSLPEVERVVLKMHFCEQKSQREIARETGLKTDEIRKSKERGIKQLRMRLKNDYSVKERNQEDDISFLEEDMSDAAMEMLDLL